MTIQEKRNQIAARMNAAYLRYDYAGIDAAGAALRRLDAVIADIAEGAEVIHYDFCTAKYRGNAAFCGGELVSAYLRENDDPELTAKPGEMVIGRNGRPVQKIGIGGAIRLSWSPDQEARGLGCSDGINPEAVGRYARMYGKRRVTRGDLPWYLSDDGYIPDAILNSTLTQEVD